MTNQLEFTPSQLIVSPLDVPAGTTIHQLFDSVAEACWSQLLDSGGSQASGSRYDIMLWQPAVTLTTKDGVTELTDMRNRDAQRIAITESPIHVAIETTTAFTDSIDMQHDNNSCDLPFVLGMAGLISYDFGRYLETLPAINNNDYCCPDFAAGIYDQAIIFDNQTNQFWSCRLSYVEAPNVESMLAASKRSDFSLCSGWQSNVTKSQYLTALESIYHYLVSGDCYQVNFAQRFEAVYTGSCWQAFKTLTATNKAPFSAYLCLPHCQILSVSPERFIQCKNGLIETKPIKGTRPRFSDSSQDELSAKSLLNAEKDRAENLMIVDLLRNDISKHSEPGSVTVPELFALESYPAVHHMVSKIQSKLDKDSHPLTLLASCFPGGSITGAPKIRAMEIIEELEPNRRAAYCGSVFYLGLRQDLDSSICIRTLLAENNTLYCWAGGGIVLDSDPHEEYDETLAKVAKILPVMELNIE